MPRPRARRTRAPNRSRWKRVQRPEEDHALCPKCLSDISSFNYREDAVNYGRYTPDNWDYGDQENNGDVTFYCPDCGEDIPGGSDDIDEYFKPEKWAEMAEEKHFILTDEPLSRTPTAATREVLASVEMYGDQPGQVGPQKKLGIPQKDNRLGHYRPKPVPAT